MNLITAALNAVALNVEHAWLALTAVPIGAIAVAALIVGTLIYLTSDRAENDERSAAEIAASIMAGVTAGPDGMADEWSDRRAAIDAVRYAYDSTVQGVYVDPIVCGYAERHTYAASYSEFTAYVDGRERVTLENVRERTLHPSGHWVYVVEVPNTVHGDYVGSDINAANYAYLLQEYPDTFVTSRDAMGAESLWLALTGPLVPTALIRQIAGLTDYALVSEAFYETWTHVAVTEAWSKYDRDLCRDELEARYDGSEDFASFVSDAELDSARDAVLSGTESELISWSYAEPSHDTEALARAIVDYLDLDTRWARKLTDEYRVWLAAQNLAPEAFETSLMLIDDWENTTDYDPSCIRIVSEYLQRERSGLEA